MKFILFFLVFALHFSKPRYKSREIKNNNLMEVTKMEKQQTTILVSVYSWTVEKVEKQVPAGYNNELDFFFDTTVTGDLEITTAQETIYEVEVSSIGDLAELYNRFHCKVQFKKPTDKNWYSYRQMSRRLFKPAISELKLVGIKNVDFDYDKLPWYNRFRWRSCGKDYSMPIAHKVM